MSDATKALVTQLHKAANYDHCPFGWGEMLRSAASQLEALADALASGRELIVAHDDLSDEERDWCEWTRRLLREDAGRGRLITEDDIAANQAATERDEKLFQDFGGRGRR